MSYFLKKQNQGKQVYLAIYESYYSSGVKGTKHRSYKFLGSVNKLKESGIDDPIAFYQKEVDKLNADVAPKSETLISDTPVIKNLGYFPLKSLMNKLKVKNIIDLFKYTNDFDYDLYTLISSLIYARCVKPCSKYKTYFEVIPSLFETVDYSYDQLLDGLSFIGNDYEKFVELFYSSYKKTYGLDCSNTYFDCTNFCFEIDKEDDFRRKGPSKEMRKDPLVGLGLLLDANQIPIWMKLYPGNESEKPILRDVIKSIKERDGEVKRTIHVADKGLNCAENIAFSKSNKDGYIFSKSVKQLPEKEKVWVLNKNDWKAVKDKDKNIIYKYKSCIDEFPYTIEKDGKKIKVNLKEKRLLTYNPSLAKKKLYEIDRMVEKAKTLVLSKAKKSEFGESSKFVDFIVANKKTGEVNDDSICLKINEDKILKEKQLAGYNLIVTSEINVSDKQLYETYHNLWRIEESFKVMKTDLDARPVFVQKEDTIKGHFLICYLTVMLERILQFKVYNNEYCTDDLMNFFKDFSIVKTDNGYINSSKSTDFITKYTEKTSLPLNHLNISELKLKKILNYNL